MGTDALKIISSIPGTFIEAGSPFSITTTVTNAYDENIKIISYEYEIPYQVQWIHDKEYTEEYRKLQDKPKILLLFGKSPWKTTARPPGETMIFTYNEPIVVLPGEVDSYTFKALVPKWLFQTGNETTFMGQIKYLFKEETHTSAFQVKFIVRPPLIANIIGAILGGVLGTTANALQGFGTTSTGSFDISYLTGSALAVILGIIIVVFSSRKTTSTQPILSIEDFWGGLFAGFLVGYIGPEFFGNVVPIPQ